MIRGYRIVSRRWAASAFSGYGAAIAGGRWNSVGTAVVYAAETRALAMLEQLVHFDPGFAPVDMVCIPFSAPSSSLVECASASLPPNWRTYPAPPALAQMGDQWAAQRTSLLLRVPSAVVPGEYNLLLNPAHPEAHKVRLDAVEDITFDSRLLR